MKRFEILKRECWPDLEAEVSRFSLPFRSMPEELNDVEALRIGFYDTAGGQVSTEGREKIALCRCGASSTKPFCDGTHSRIGFQAAERVNPDSEEKSK